MSLNVIFFGILAVSYILFIKYNITFKQIGEGERNLLVTWERLSTMDRQTKCLIQTNLASHGWCL